MLDDPIEFADNNYVRPGTAADNHIDMNVSKNKRIFSGIPEKKRTRNIQPVCNKSINTMGQTELLNDLCGMVQGLGGDGDDDIEIGSDYPYPTDNIAGPPTLG